MPWHSTPSESAPCCSVGTAGMQYWVIRGSGTGRFGPRWTILVPDRDRGTPWFTTAPGKSASFSEAGKVLRSTTNPFPLSAHRTGHGGPHPALGQDIRCSLSEGYEPQTDLGDTWRWDGQDWT